MSVHFTADSIVAPSNPHHLTAQMNGQSCINSSSSRMETQTLMDTTNQHHQGRLGTPGMQYQASYMSSDFKNKQQEQHTSQTASFGDNAQDLFAKLSEALALEPKYQPNLFLPLQSNVSIFYCFLKVLFFFCDVVLEEK
jgi:hypothetical protein